MSPEQAEGITARVDERTDVFALGAIADYGLTGRPPFAADSVLIVLARVGGEEPIPLTSQRPDVTPAPDPFARPGAARRRRAPRRPSGRGHRPQHRMDQRLCSWPWSSVLEWEPAMSGMREPPLLPGRRFQSSRSPLCPAGLDAAVGRKVQTALGVSCHEDSLRVQSGRRFRRSRREGGADDCHHYAVFKNPDYQEQVCHHCGRGSPTSVARPLCRQCFGGSR